MAEADLKAIKLVNRAAGEDGFKDKTVLVTGGTGFMGKVLVEKILRTCPLVKRIYILLRSKKGKNPSERLDEIQAGPLYNLLKETHGPEILNKVVAIPGDVMELDLGLSQEHRKMLAEEADVIYHLAATVRFDEPLKKAILLNTRGTKLMLEFAKEFKKLQVFVHLSTAYCHLHERVLYEKAYPPPADPHKIIKIAEELDEKAVEANAKQIRGDSPNSYAFTKALGEALVADEMDNLPVIILRPSVVIPIWKEPLPGWSDNINGPTGLLIGAGKGVIRTMYCNDKHYADFLPVDIAINTIILASGDYVYYKKRRIYNCTSSFKFKVSWYEILELGRKIISEKMPLNGVVWYPGGSMKTSRWQHNFCVVVFHYIPAIIIDSLLFILGYRPILWRIQQRITKGFEMFEYYANKQWDFNNEDSLKARELMTEAEKVIYKVDEKGFDMEEYFTSCIHAARLYILKETDDTLPAARRHMKLMWFVDRVVRLLIFGGFLYLLIALFNKLF